MHGVWGNRRCLSGAGSGRGVRCSSLEVGSTLRCRGPGSRRGRARRRRSRGARWWGGCPRGSHPSLPGLCRVSPDRGRSAGAQRRDDQGTAQRGSAPGFPDAGGNDSSSQGRPVPQPRGAAGESGEPPRGALPPLCPVPQHRLPPAPSGLPAGLGPPWAKASLVLLSGAQPIAKAWR